jgi:hypothetical protein
MLGKQDSHIIPLLAFTFLSLVSPSYFWVWTRFPYPFIGFYFSIFSIPQLFLGVEKIPISSLYWVLLFYLQYPPAIPCFAKCCFFWFPFCAPPVVTFLRSQWINLLQWFLGTWKFLNLMKDLVRCCAETYVQVSVCVRIQEFYIHTWHTCICVRILI